MTIAQLKKTASKLSETDATVMLFLLKRRLLGNSADSRRELSARHADIQAGRRLTLQQLRRLEKAVKA